MEPKFQTSFIPKSPVVSQANSSVHVTHSTNIFSVIATFVFIVTLIGSGSVFIYKNFLTGQIATDSAQLTAAQNNFEPATVQQLIDANTRLSSVKTLLQNHVAVSAVLNNMSYAAPTGTMPPTLTMDATAATYNALAEQEAVFSANESVKSSAFTDFTLGDNGQISAKFFAKLDPALISYAKSIEAASQ